MKRQSQSRIGRVFGSIFRFREWLDVDRNMDSGVYVADTAKKVFSVQQPGEEETFEEAMKRNNIDEKELLRRKKMFFRLACLMLLASFAFGMYSLYHILNGSLFALLISNVLAAVSAALAFRYHYWYYQLKAKKLGCSLKEWYTKGLLGRSS